MIFARTRSVLRRIANRVPGSGLTQSARHRGAPGRRARKTYPQPDYAGPREMLRLILDAPLEPGRKLVLISLILYATWGTWDGIFVTQRTLAADTGYSRKWVGRLLRLLKEDKVLAEVPGGPRPRGRPTDRGSLRICVAELERLAIRAGRLRGGERSPRGARTPGPPCANSGPTGRARSSHNLQGSPSIDHPPPPRPGEPRGSQAIGEPRPVSAEAERLLVEFGVYGPNAKRLALEHSAEEVREGISRVSGRARSVKSPSGLLVSLLRDGGLARVIARRRARHQTGLDRELQMWRTSRVDELMGATGEFRRAPNRDELLAMEGVVRGRWLTNEEIAAAGVLADDELRLARKQPLELLAKLAAAAAESSSDGSSPNPGGAS